MAQFEYESELAKIESRANKVISKLRSSNQIDRPEKSILAEYIYVMDKRRTKRDEQIRATLLKERSKTVFDMKADGFRLAGEGRFGDAWKLLAGAEYLASDEAVTDILRKSMVRNVGIVQQELVEMQWQFVRPSPPNNYFVTSDNPVVFDRGAGLKAATLIFPVARNLLLIADHAGERDLLYRESSEDETLKLNVTIIVTADREVYAPAPDQWIHRGWTEGFTFSEKAVENSVL